MQSLLSDEAYLLQGNPAQILIHTQKGLYPMKLVAIESWKIRCQECLRRLEALCTQEAYTLYADNLDGLAELQKTKQPLLERYAKLIHELADYKTKVSVKQWSQEQSTLQEVQQLALHVNTMFENIERFVHQVSSVWKEAIDSLQQQARNVTNPKNYGRGLSLSSTICSLGIEERI